MPNAPNYRIEFITDLRLLHECVEIQREVWGFSDVDLLPLRLLVVTRRIGGQVLGAVNAEGKLLGFLTAVPGYREGEIYLHSHMMGVLPQYRNLGIGRSLKLAQRQDALSRGISTVEWTFDPLEIRNANFNIESLGVICRRYYVNTYGVTSSPLHGNLPTDRLVAEWHLSSSRVRSKISRLSSSLDASKETVRVELPLNIQELKTAYPPLVTCIQMDLRNRFLELFNRDYCVSRVELDDSKKLAAYVLELFDKGLFLS